MNTLLREEDCVRATTPHSIDLNDEIGEKWGFPDREHNASISSISFTSNAHTSVSNWDKVKIYGPVRSQAFTIRTAVCDRLARCPGLEAHSVIYSGSAQHVFHVLPICPQRDWGSKSEALTLTASGTTASLVCLIYPDQQPEEPGTLARFQRRLAASKGRLFTGLVDSLAKQLSYLLEDEDELAELSRSPDMRSFEALLAYCAERPWVRAPSLTLTRNGDFVASWRPTPHGKARISIEFMPDKRVRWSAADARNTGSAPTVTGGICSVAELDEHLGRYYRGWIRL